MLDWLSEPFVELALMRRSILGLIILSAGAAPVGVFMTLRRMSLTGDALAHAMLPGIAIAYLIFGLDLNAMALGGLVAGVLVLFLSAYTSRNTLQSHDSSLGVLHSIFLSLGVVIISVVGNNVDLVHILFGSVLALDDSSLILLTVVSSVSILILSIFFRAFILDTLDSSYLALMSNASKLVHYTLLFLIVLNLVAGFQTVGSLLIVGLMIAPGAIARFWTHNIYLMMVLAFLIAVASSLIGLYLSWYLNFPAGASIILALGCGYLLSVFLGYNQGIVTQWLIRHRPHFRN